MALTIVIRSGELTQPPAISFDTPRVVVGRGEGCDVRLPDLSVSHRHATFRQRGADYLVVDEGSTNGTFVASVRLPPQTPRVVRSGDVIRVGRIWLEARIEPVAPTQQSTLVTREIALGLVADALAADGEPATVRVRVRSGPDTGQELELAAFDRPYVIGRGRGVAFRLSDEDVSRRHVEITRRGDRILVKDLGSKNGATLDGDRIPEDRPVTWRKGATLALGNTELAAEDPVLAALGELERAADERMLEDESVEPPPTTADTAPAAAPRSPAEPIANATPPRPPRRAPALARRRGWQWSDTIVSLVALAVLGVSLAGLYWLLTLD
ncbi:MAG: FHA domain-containing protein [Polyangiaceae bacterium]|nr:FHA domain-containing protein [Polyangiaceae bacterium]